MPRKRHSDHPEGLPLANGGGGSESKRVLYIPLCFIINMFIIIIIMIITTEQELLCRKCSYTWTSRKRHPKACPKCKRYDWSLAPLSDRPEEFKDRLQAAKDSLVDKDFDFGA